jgi:putative oxidoreductase
LSPSQPYTYPHGFFMNSEGNQNGEGFEYPLLALGIAISLIITSGGIWSVDHILQLSAAH